MSCLGYAKLAYKWMEKGDEIVQLIMRVQSLSYYSPPLFNYDGEVNSGLDACRGTDCNLIVKMVWGIGGQNGNVSRGPCPSVGLRTFCLQT